MQRFLDVNPPCFPTHGDCHYDAYSESDSEPASDGCQRCGCTSMFTPEGERMCYCDSCWIGGCVGSSWKEAWARIKHEMSVSTANELEHDFINKGDSTTQ